MIRRVLGVAAYEARMQFRSLVLWLGIILVAAMFMSEVADPARHAVNLLQEYRAHPGQLTGNEAFQAVLAELRAEGVSSERAAFNWSDRMGLVLSFVGLFTAGFVFERDRLTRGGAVVAARPVGSLEYAVGKYLGVAGPLLVVVALSLLAALGVNWWAQSTLGFPFTPAAFLAPAGLLVVTVLYVPALVLAATALVQRAVMVIPVYLVYLFIGGINPAGMEAPAALGRFILRADNRDAVRAAIESGLALENRLLYLGLTLVLIGVTGWAYQRLRRERG